MRIQAIIAQDDGTQSIRLDNGKMIELTQTDVRLMELAFHTHCPGCQHERGLVE